MFYSDKETKAFEEAFQQHLAKARGIANVDMGVVMSNLQLIAGAVDKLKQKQDKTPEEIEQLLEIKERMESLLQSIKDTQLVLFESARRSALAFYENVKQQAELGNEQALKIYLDLKPGYEAMMLEQLNNN